MGLGLRLTSDLPRRGWLRRAPTAARLLDLLEQAARARSAKLPAPLAGWADTHRGDAGLQIGLFPGEERIELVVEEGQVTCSAKTSTAGPGYHAAVVGLLDALAGEVGLDWRAPEPGDAGDETGFLAHRDFARLQAEMAGWLRRLAGQVLDFGEVDGPLLLGVPVGFLPRSEAFAASTMGEWSRAWMAEMAGATDGRALELAAQFFPWWDQGTTARDLKGFGLSRAWTDLRWVVPEDEAEAALSRSVLDCFDEAARRDPSLPAPEEAAELRRLLEPGATLQPPSAAGIGFRRRLLGRSLPGGWTIDLPGYYAESLEDDGGTQVYFFPGRTVRGSSLTVHPRPGLAAGGPERILGPPKADRDEQPLVLRLPHLAGRTTFTWNEGEQCHVLEAHVAKGDGLCIATFWLDEERDRAWALEAAATISAPPPEGP